MSFLDRFGSKISVQTTNGSRQPLSAEALNPGGHLPSRRDGRARGNRGAQRPQQRRTAPRKPSPQPSAPVEYYSNEISPSPSDLGPESDPYFVPAPQVVKMPPPRASFDASAQRRRPAPTHQPLSANIAYGHGVYMQQATTDYIDQSVVIDSAPPGAITSANSPPAAPPQDRSQQRPAAKTSSGATNSASSNGSRNRRPGLSQLRSVLQEHEYEERRGFSPVYPEPCHQAAQPSGYVVRHGAMPTTAPHDPSPVPSPSQRQRAHSVQPRTTVRNPSPLRSPQKVRGGGFTADPDSQSYEPSPLANRRRLLAHQLQEPDEMEPCVSWTPQPSSPSPRRRSENRVEKQRRQHQQQQQRSRPQRSRQEPAPAVERPPPEVLNEARVKSEEDQLFFSKKARQVEFQPRTLQEYQQSKPTTYVELGKLAPDLNSEELLAKRANAERVKEFSRNLRAINQQQLAAQPASAQRSQARKATPKQKSKREIAAEFAKRIPKPRVRRRSTDNEQGQSQVGHGRRTGAPQGASPQRTGATAELGALEELELQHEQRRASVEAIRRQLGV